MKTKTYTVTVTVGWDVKYTTIAKSVNEAKETAREFIAQYMPGFRHLILRSHAVADKKEE